MPTYEYECEKCQHHFEKSQSIVDGPLRTCPQDLCRLKKWGKGKVRRLVSAGAGLIFKGSGFYIRDYRSDKYKEAAKKDAPPAPASSGESKPATSSSGDGKAAKSEAKPAPAKSKSTASE